MNLSSYIFILGRQPELSIAELASIGSTDTKSCISSLTPLIINPEFTIAKGTIAEPQDFLNNLGGTIKIAEIFAETEKYQNEIVINFLSEIFKEKTGKQTFGVSAHGLEKKFLRQALLDIKKGLKKNNFSVRFANKDFENLSSPTVIKEGLIDFKNRTNLKGAEIIIVSANGKTFFGHTLAVQNPDAYALRDYDKPYRDMKVGMLPPKLAQIMLNLAGPTPKIIYDPFCGSGTLVGEAMLQNKEILASDISLDMTEACEKNLRWLANKFQLSAPASENTFIHDATLPFPKNLKFDAIITEGTLGPPQNKLPSEHECQKIFSELGELYKKFFYNLKTILPKHAPIIICFPAFQDRERTVDFFPEKYLAEIKNLGYHTCDILPREWKEISGLTQNPHGSLIYSRPEQVVAREIFHFEKE